MRYHPRRGGAEHLAPNREPPRVQLAHALIAMASSARTPERAHHILTAAVQQRLIRPTSLHDAFATYQRLPNRDAIAETLIDIDDGAQSLNEIALLRLVARIGVPRPELQLVAATDRRRSRLDGSWPQYAVAFEIDGVGHFEIGKWLDDADRQNEVALSQPEGTTLLRWPGLTVRRQPEVVASQVERALRRGGWSPV